MIHQCGTALEGNGRKQKNNSQLGFDSCSFHWICLFEGKGFGLTHVKGLPISHYKPGSKVGRTYKKIVKEILSNEKIKKDLDKEMGVLDKQGRVLLKR